MADEIVRPKTILSLDEARAAIEGKKAPPLEAMGGMKRNADKEFVLTTSLTVATGVAERVYNLMSEQQAEGLAKVEFMCLQHVNKLRDEIESRTFRGRLRRAWAWLDGWWARAAVRIGIVDEPSPYVPDPYLDIMSEHVTHEPVVSQRPAEGVVTGVTEGP